MIKLLRKVLSLLQRTFYADKVDANQQPYPSVFFRGIMSENDVDKGDYLKASAFLFGSTVPEYRNDGNKELSIVWNDCEEALNLLLRQKNKKGTGLQFPCGYATVKLSRFEDNVVRYMTGNLVGYERRPIEEDKENGIEANPYHGNILLHESTPEQQKKNIQHTLATISQFTRRTDNYQ